MPRSGWSRGSRNCGSCRRSCGTGSRRARKRCAATPAPTSAPARASVAAPATCSPGLVVCGACGGRYTKISADLFRCAAARNKGAAVCGNLRNIRRDRLEAAVLDALRDNLMDPELFREFCAE